MTKHADSQGQAPDRKKPDGSAYKAHMEGIAERNLAAKRRGRAERQDAEQRDTKARRADEVKRATALSKRKPGGRAGRKAPRPVA